MNGKTLTISPTQMAKAVANYDTLAQQNQCMDQVSLDLTDMVNVMMAWDFGDVSVVHHMTRMVPKHVKDVAMVVADAAARLRVAKEQFEVMCKDQSARIDELEDRIEGLEEDNSGLQHALDEAEDALDEAKDEIERLKGRNP